MRIMGLSSATLTSTRSEFGRIVSLLTAIILALYICAGLNSKAMAASGFSAVTVDAATGKIIYGKNIDDKRYPASLTKVMTLYVLFEEIEAGRMSFSTSMKVSKKASLQQPSKLGLRAGSTISARDAMYALITKSANDAAMVIAEHISGSQDAFAKRMTSTARSIGMTRSTFTNPNGLPDTRQVTTARDMATLGLRIQRDFPGYYKYFATRSFKYGRRTHGNHNRLLGRLKGVDGIKTGYTRASGFNLISSRELNGRRIVGVVLGGKTGNARNTYMTNILNRDIAKATLNGNRIAAVAGSPAGYSQTAEKARARTVDAEAPSVEPAIANPPVPREKPVVAIQKAPEQVQIAAIAKSISAGPVPSAAPVEAATETNSSITEQETVVVPAQGVTFASVVVPTTSTKSDSLIVASASQLPAPEIKNQARIDDKTNTANTAASDVPTSTKGTKVISDPAKIEARLAEHQSSWNIQIGAFPTQEGAKSRIIAAKATKVSLLNDATPFLMAIDKDGGTIYRARFSGLNKSQAATACRQLKRAGVGCFPLAPSS